MTPDFLILRRLLALQRQAIDAALAHPSSTALVRVALAAEHAVNLHLSQHPHNGARNMPELLAA